MLQRRREDTAPLCLDVLRYVVFALLALMPLSCRHDGPTGPNVLLVVWDTVRADHLSLYGHSQLTTPRLDAFARDARVFDDCASVGSTTVPAHASIFTGLLPAEHGQSNRAGFMDDSFVTLAETLRGAGYRTYLFSENPFVREGTGLTQGFDLVEHPWSPAHRRQAAQIVRAKLDPEDRSNDVAKRHASGDLKEWEIASAAPLVERALLRWLDQGKRRPFFAVLNYVEAHYPLIPPREVRKALMTPEQVAASYLVDRRSNVLWDYTLGLRDYRQSDIELTQLTYDAALLELDRSLQSLLDALRARGDLENTIVALVSDHGEHLGEKHMLDHQFSVYEPLMRVPLVLWYPARVPAGREHAPVTNMDLFPTLLELAGVPVPTVSTAVSLLRPSLERVRLGTYAAVTTPILEMTRSRHPRFDPTPFQRTLQALYRGPWKLILASDGSRSLFDLAHDPREESDLAPQRADVVRSLERDLAVLLAAARSGPTNTPASAPDAETRARLEALGYAEEFGSAARGPAEKN